jgi:hypothetical protein
VSTIHRWHRGSGLDRAGELPGSVSAVRERQAERPPIDPLPRLPSRFQDGFDSADRRFQDGFEAVGKRGQRELGTLEKLLTSAEFQQRLSETLAGTSPRALQVKQVESTYQSYQSFWKDSQDFSTRKGPALSVPEPPRFVSPAETAWKGRALTVPEFQASTGDLPEAARVPQAAQAVGASAEARRAPLIPAASFALLGRAELRG